MKRLSPKYFGILFLAIIALFVLFGLTGCKSHKDLTKTKTSVDQMEAVHAALSSTAASTTTTTEKAKGEVAVPEKSMSATGNTTNGPLIFDGPVFSGTVTTDPATGLTKLDVKSKPFTVPFEIDKTTTSTAASTLNAEIDSSKETHSTVATKELHKDNEVESPINLNYIWLILAGVVAFFLWWFFGFRKEKEKRPGDPGA